MATKRKSDIWISNNRVLVGGNKKVTGRNPNFDMEETKLLISLWGDPKVQKTLITAHKKHAVIVKLAEKMREYGYFRSPEEINTRIKNLKCFYNRIKKAMEMGIAAEPTWKHYQAMDEIMTRPIFSVRPNEIPKPSLRYRLEEEMRDKEMNEKSEKDSEATGSDEDEKMSITEEMFEEEMAQETEVEEEEDKLKKEIDSNSDVEETPLIIPKQEPIDVDDETDPTEKEREDEHNNDIFPKLSAYLQLASNTSSNATTVDNKIITTISSSVLSPVSDTTTTTTPTTQLKISQPIVIANQQTPQPGKISLVPTNFLLKPQQSQIQIRPQTQHRILYTKPSGQSAQGIVTSGTGQMPMKVLLVNTLQKSPGASNTVCSTDTQPKTLTASNIQPQIRHVPSPAPEKTHKDSTGAKKKEEVTGLKTLLKQLVQLQADNLEINKHRLDVERQRLDFEKSAIERIINAVSLFQIPNGAPLLLKPKVEKED